MSIVYLIGQAEIYEYYKDTNRIESSFIFLLFGIIHFFHNNKAKWKQIKANQQWN